ncbi:MAG TPA: hypothetical protein VLA25_05795, partial [Methylotenera sp.]|nr:hypothetical protein [Methylotenera sp.]
MLDTKASLAKPSQVSTTVDASELPSITTREFWHNISHPTDSTLGKAILMLLVFAESLVCIFWIYT